MVDHASDAPTSRILDNRELDIELAGAARTLFIRNYWQKLPRDDGNALPRYSHVDLMDLYPVAATLTVKDVINGGTDFFNRFWGSKLTEYVGFEGTDLHVSEYDLEPMRTSLLNRYGQIARTGKPILSRGHFQLYELANIQRYEVLHVPLLGNHGDNVAHIISAFDFDLDPLRN